MRALLAIALCACAAPRPAVELVETTPIETTLDHPDIADAYVVWLDMIRGAQHTIDLAQFYYSDTPGSRLEPIVEAIEQALRRGVKVRVLAEASFVKVYPKTLDRLGHAGAEVRALDLGTGGIHHAKYFIVDDRDAFLGSQNFDWRSITHNYELGARIRDPDVIAQLDQVFGRDWAAAIGQPDMVEHRFTHAVGSVTLLGSPFGTMASDVSVELPVIVDMIQRARASVHVELLTYKAGDWTTLEEPLRGAALRGVDVELLLADWCKRPGTIEGLQQLARTSKVQIRLITIPPWSGGFIPFARVAHAKAMVVDGKRAWLGTSNWERSYFEQDRDLALIVDDPALAAKIDRFFTTAWGSSYSAPLDPNATYAPPRIE